MLDTKTIGKNIKELRKQRGLTQNAFAEILNVSFQAVSNWERGITPPDLENLLNIAEYFSVSIGSLFYRGRENLFLGIDGGGTKTEFVVVSSEGYIIKRLFKKGCNPNDIGFEESLKILSNGIDDVMTEYPSVKAAFLGIAGATAGDYSKRLRSEFEKKYPQTVFEVKSDAYNLFAIDERADMVVISGTGSVVFVRTDDGCKRIGGWGYLLDRAGSAYDVGADALREALRQEDYGESPSLLYKMLLKKINTTCVWEHINTIYNEGKPYIAGLASTVFEAYGKGDKKAQRIVDDTAKALAERLNSGVELYGANPIAIAGGGLFEHYRNIMIAHIEKYTDVKLIPVDLPPVYGACKKALSLTGEKPNVNFYDNFKKDYGGIER